MTRSNLLEMRELQVEYSASKRDTVTRSIDPKVLARDGFVENYVGVRFERKLDMTYHYVYEAILADSNQQCVVDIEGNHQ